MDDLNRRVVEVMVKMGVSKTTFANDLEVSQGLITHISTGRNKPGVELLQKILLKYPSINAEWLLLGSGGMEKGKGFDLMNLKLNLQLAENRLNDALNTLETVKDTIKNQTDSIV
jgi:predicted transcriptional regulator